MSVAGDIVRRAGEIIDGNRQTTHGQKERSFGLVAEFWSSYFGIKIAPREVAQALELLKLARSKCGDPGHLDHYIDAAGYAGCAGELAAAERKVAFPTGGKIGVGLADLAIPGAAERREELQALKEAVAKQLSEGKAAVIESTPVPCVHRLRTYLEAVEQINALTAANRLEAFENGVKMALIHAYGVEPTPAKETEKCPCGCVVTSAEKSNAADPGRDARIAKLSAVYCPDGVIVKEPRRVTGDMDRKAAVTGAGFEVLKNGVVAVDVAAVLPAITEAPVPSVPLDHVCATCKYDGTLATEEPCIGCNVLPITTTKGLLDYVATDCWEAAPISSKKGKKQ